MNFFTALREWRQAKQVIASQHRQLFHTNPPTKGNKMDILATLAANGAAITQLQQQAAAQPTTNFATLDVQRAIVEQSTALGVVIVSTASAPAPVAPAAS